MVTAPFSRLALVVLTLAASAPTTWAQTATCLAGHANLQFTYSSVQSTYNFGGNCAGDLSLSGQLLNTGGEGIASFTTSQPAGRNGQTRSWSGGPVAVEFDVSCLPFVRTSFRLRVRSTCDLDASQRWVAEDSIFIPADATDLGDAVTGVLFSDNAEVAVTWTYQWGNLGTGSPTASPSTAAPTQPPSASPTPRPTTTAPTTPGPTTLVTTTIPSTTQATQPPSSTQPVTSAPSTPPPSTSASPTTPEPATQSPSTSTTPQPTVSPSHRNTGPPTAPSSTGTPSVTRTATASPLTTPPTTQPPVSPPQGTTGRPTAPPSTGTPSVTPATLPPTTRPPTSPPTTRTPTAAPSESVVLYTVEAGVPCNDTFPDITSEAACSVAAEELARRGAITVTDPVRPCNTASGTASSTICSGTRMDVSSSADSPFGCYYKPANPIAVRLFWNPRGSASAVDTNPGRMTICGGPSASPTAGPTPTPTEADPCNQYLCSIDCDGPTVRGSSGIETCGWDRPSNVCSAGHVTTDEERAARYESVPGGCPARAAVDDNNASSGGDTALYVVVGVVLAAIGIGALVVLSRRQRTATPAHLAAATINPTFAPVVYPTVARRSTASQQHLHQHQQQATRGQPVRAAPTDGVGDSRSQDVPMASTAAATLEPQYDEVSTASPFEPQYAEVDQYETPADLRATDEGGYATGGLVSNHQQSLA